MDKTLPALLRISSYKIQIAKTNPVEREAELNQESDSPEVDHAAFAANEMAVLSAECAKEQIHIPGAVQPHGVLLTLRSSDLTILQVSESVFDVLGVHSSELIYQPLAKLLDVTPVEYATKRLGDRVPRLLNPIPISVMVRGKEKFLDGILHRAGRVLVLELEEHLAEVKGYGGFGGFYELIRDLTSKMMITENLSEVLELACQELRKLTGFSRVMAYRFDEDWNGEVVNESKDDLVSTLLHHHFPASDIPPQARELYTTNWLRLIPNVDYKPSIIVPSINPITDKPLDMSNAVLRSVSPVHLEYMRNMGLRASMSVSLLKGRKLWGLISCHDFKPRYLKYDVRVASEFVGQMVSAQIMAREESTEVDHKLQLKKLYDDMIKSGSNYTSVGQTLTRNAASLLGLVEAQGAAVCFNGDCILIGSTPPRSEVDGLRNWVVARGEPLFASEYLKGELPNEFTANPLSSGLLAINLPRGKGDCVLWFRPETRAKTRWAGDPAMAKNFDTGRISPRKSFETWFDNSADRSRRWRAPELDAAEELRNSIMTMATGLISEPRTASGETFRDSLVNSLATTEATKVSREPSKDEKSRSFSFVEAAQTSNLLLDSFSEFGVLFLDLNGTIQNWSSGAKWLLGHTRVAALGQTLDLFLSEEQILKGKTNRVLESVRQNGRCEEEMWLFRADATSFWAKILAAQVRDDGDQLFGFSIVIQDVTKEKAAEEELKSTKASAEAANSAKTAFLANISHEIRTPLGAVLGFSELMTSNQLSEDDRLTLYSKVRRNGEQLTVLINDLLDLGKVESGKIEIEKIEVDLNSMLFDLEQLFAMRASENGVLLNVRLEGALPATIVSDPTRLRQILINLLSNALKFTPSGGKAVLSCSIHTAAQGPQLVFKVSDTGRGMTPAEMEKLFKPFAQADASTTRKYGGTGLGLFLSQRLARSLGGDLTIEWSEPGKGTIFAAHIDAGLSASDLAKTPMFARLSERSHMLTRNHLENSDLSGRRILLVDDSPDNRELLTTYLKKAGALVDVASNGRDGVVAALKQNYDVVLMDIQMPVVDGNQAMRLLIEKGYTKPVIALTAHAMKEERDYSLAMGFRDYITKPVDRKLLIARVAELSAKPL